MEEQEIELEESIIEEPEQQDDELDLDEGIEETEEPKEEVVEKPEPKKRVESQVDRLKREKKELQDKLNAQSTGLSIEDTIAITTSGIHKDDIKEVLDYAKYKGLSFSEAMDSPVVKMTLKENAQARARKASTLQSTNRTGVQGDEVARAVARYKKDGTLPDNNPALVSKIMNELTK